MLLLISKVFPDIEVAVDCIIHLWYSAFIPRKQVDRMKQLVLPYIQEVCKGLERRSATLSDFILFYASLAPEREVDVLALIL